MQLHLVHPFYITFYLLFRIPPTVCQLCMKCGKLGKIKLWKVESSPYFNPGEIKNK